MRGSLLALILAAPAVAGAQPAVETPIDAADVELEYLLSTPQIPKPMRPLEHARPAAGRLIVRTAVVSVADPLETHLGRAFDIQLSSMTRAFHAKGYVVDGFAFTWNPKFASGWKEGKRLPEKGTQDFGSQHRHWPSVLLFRKDAWRGPGGGVEYFVVFLVGESPTFGLQRPAFRKAARCAAALDDPDGDRLSRDDLAANCYQLFTSMAQRRRQSTLNVIGPSFSGSMESLALALGDLFRRSETHDPRHRLNVDVASPSASVTSNRNVTRWAKSLSQAAGRIEYRTLAWSLEDQLGALCEYVHQRFGNDREPIVLLAEESTFGQGVSALLEGWKRQGTEASATWQACARRVRVTQFPQNVSAVRGEHSLIAQEKGRAWRDLLKSRSKLLELDLSGVDESTDRPPTYHRGLSSRSDELMLYGTFDALRVWVKPAVVAIVATDIRDRLFLLNEVRKSLPAALPVLLEMDYLSAHPDYRKISRGSLVVPNGNTLVCLAQQALEGGRWAVVNCPYPNATYYAFPSDYSANLFRAVLGLIDEKIDAASDMKPCVEGGAESRAHSGLASVFQALVPAVSDKGEDRKKRWGAQRECPVPRVTTLAGFQELAGGRLSTLLAADSRLSLERPTYLFMMLAGAALGLLAWWLLVHGRGHLAVLSPMHNWSPFPGVREEKIRTETAERRENADIRAIAAGTPIERWEIRSLRWAHWAPAMLAVAAGIVLLVALDRSVLLAFFPRKWNWDLAHGRDELALACLLLIYLGIALIGGWRIALWNERCCFYCRCLTRDLDGSSEESRALASSGQRMITVLPLLFALMLFLWFEDLPTSVDSHWPAIVASVALLVAGVWFLAQFWSQWRRWAWLALRLARTVDAVAAAPPGERPSGVKAGGDAWPTPVLLNDLPQSPFGLHFRERDLRALYSQPDEVWALQTRELIDGQWPFAHARGPRFLDWQARLVAEMRYAAVAVRSGAWCAILAPTAALLAMALYPPVSERLITSAAIVLILLGFMLVMFVTLRLEQHPMLSRMFTQHGDRLTVGSAFSALWPKLIAASLILVPVLFPDFLESIYGLLKSINSLQ